MDSVAVQIRVEKVEMAPGAVGGLDFPTQDTFPGPWLEIGGWILDPGEVDRLVALYCHAYTNYPIAVARLHVRADVNTAISLAPDACCGFRFRANLRDLGSNMRLDLCLLSEVQLESTPHLSLQETFGSIYAECGGDQSKPIFTDFAPLFVTSLGRSGSTYLTDLLRASRDVFAYDRYPSEARLFAYWFHILRVVGSPEDATAIKEQFADNPMAAGPCPFFSDYPEIESLFVDNIDGWLNKIGKIPFEMYSQLLASAGKHPKYVMEKSAPSSLVSYTAERLCPAFREIVMVRDFRDMIASTVSFSRKTGGGRMELAMTDFRRESLHWFSIQVNTLLEYCRRRKGKSVLIMKYEDLINNKRDTLDAIGSFLDIEIGDASDVDVEFRTPHATSANALQSIGKYKEMLSVCEIKEFEAMIVSSLGYFDYPLHS
jgi:hypothetical protein